MIRRLLFVVLMAAGCSGSLSMPDADQDQDTAGAGPCHSDPVTGIGFRDSVTVQQTDGTTCVATYTVEGGVNTLDCPCTEPTACTAADRYLTAEAKACGVHQ